IRSRVMPGSLVTMERRVPVNRLKSVDLPTLGRPTMTSDGRRSGISSWAGATVGAAACWAIFQCSAFRVARVEGVHPRHFVSISKERTYKFAFHKYLILKEMFLAAQAKHKPPNSLPQKRKAGASSRTRNVVIYSRKYSTD